MNEDSEISEADVEKIEPGPSTITLRVSCLLCLLVIGIVNKEPTCRHQVDHLTENSSYDKIELEIIFQK